MTIEEKLAQIETQQESLKKASGDFVRIGRKAEDGFNYEVVDYGDSAKKSFGYQVIFIETRQDGDYIKIVGYGPEAASRTSEWSLIEKHV